MLSVKSLGAASSELAAYYESLARDDYYEAGSEPPGQWQGRLAHELDLYGTVKPGQLGNIFRGIHPITRVPLSKNAGDGHKAAWDLTFSAPKSVSLVWAISDQPTQAAISRAHDQAVAKALAYLEKRAFSSRDRQEPQSGKGSILAAVFQHGTSREMDPQLHSHAVVANLGLRIDGSWCALDFDTRWKMAAGAVYRAELAYHLQSMGYDIERDASSFRIADIGKDMTDSFSKRRQQIIAELEKTGYTGAKAAGVAALATRQTKQEVDRQVLMPLWREQATSLGLDETKIRVLRHDQQRLSSRGPMVLEGILEALTYASSTFTRMQLEAILATEAQGKLNADEIVTLVSEFIRERQQDDDPQGLVRLRPRTADSRREYGVEYFTTNEMLTVEQAIVDGVIARKSENRHLVSAAPGLINHPQLSAEQILALNHITESEGAVSVIRGLAGTGKSMLLAAAKDSWEANGMTVIGVALAGKAADSLETGSGIKGQTLHSLIAELEGKHRVLTDHHVVVIDEAGMVGSRQLKRVLDQVHMANAKVVLVGDTQQLQSIEAGGMFRHLSDIIGYAELTNICRQEKQADRDMIGHLIAGKSQEVLADLKIRGMLIVERGANLHESVVNSWADRFDSKNPEKTMMLAGTRSDVFRLNMLAREQLKVVHRLHTVMVVETERGPREFCVGERMLFTRNSKQLRVKNGQTGTLVGWAIGSNGNVECNITVDDGKHVLVNANQYQHLEYGYAVSTHKAQGQTVDNTFVLMSDAMVDREWSYVVASRHRKELRVFVAEEQVDVIEQQMNRSRKKEVAIRSVTEKSHTSKGKEEGHVEKFQSEKQISLEL